MRAERFTTCCTLLFMSRRGHRSRTIIPNYSFQIAYRSQWFVSWTIKPHVGHIQILTHFHKIKTKPHLVRKISSTSDSVSSKRMNYLRPQRDSRFKVATLNYKTHLGALLWSRLFVWAEIWTSHWADSGSGRGRGKMLNSYIQRSLNNVMHFLLRICDSQTAAAQECVVCSRQAVCSGVLHVFTWAIDTCWQLVNSCWVLIVQI